MRFLLKCLPLVLLAKICIAENILYITDIHFNPYGLCKTQPCPKLNQLIEKDIKDWPQILSADKVIKYHIETSNELLISGLSALAPFVKQNDIHNAFITGDLLAHGFNQNYYKFAPTDLNNQKALTQFSAKVSDYVFAQIERATDHAKILYVLGNNDGDHEDYVVPSKSYLVEAAKVLNDYIPHDSSASFIKDFSTAGYFNIALNDNVQVIGINSNLLSRSSPNLVMAKQQYKWFSKSLKLAKLAHKKVIILQHIPYGADTYMSARTGVTTMVMDAKLQQQCQAPILCTS